MFFHLVPLQVAVAAFGVATFVMLVLVGKLVLWLINRD